MAVNLSYGERYGWMVVQVAGEVDISGVAALRERLNGLIADGRHRIVVDISRLDFCDSTGFGVLVATRRLLLARGGRLRLALPGPEVHTRKVLSAFGIERLFEVYDSVEDALGDQRDALQAVRGAVPEQRSTASASAD